MEVSMSKTRRGKYTDNRICYISKCKGDMRLYLRRKGKLPCFSYLVRGKSFSFYRGKIQIIIRKVIIWLIFYLEKSSYSSTICMMCLIFLLRWDEWHTFYHYHRSIESQCHGAFLAGMVYINQVGSVFGDALIGLDIGDNLIIIIQRFGANIMATYLHCSHTYIIRNMIPPMYIC